MHIHSASKREKTISLWDGVFMATIFFGTLFVYLKTLTPSLSSLSPDGSELATIPAILGLAHSPGYPLYTWLGYLFSQLPWQDVAFRMNLMSAVSAALANALLYLFVVRLDIHREEKNNRVLYRAAILLAVLLFAFSKDFWSQAIITEVYAPNMLMILICLLLLQQWEKNRKNGTFFFFALTYGLSMGTHLSNLGFAPGMAVFVLLCEWRVLKDWKWWLSALSGFGLGILQFLWLPFNASGLNDRLMQRSAPTSLQGIYSYTLDSFSNLKFAYPISMLPDRLVLYFSLLLQQYGWLGFGIGVVGMYALLLWKPRYFYLTMGMYLVHIWFFIQYQAFDLEVFFIPAHMLWAVFMACGIYALLSGMISLLKKLIRRLKKKSIPCFLQYLASISLLIALVFFPVRAQIVENYAINDHSEDTTISDFYANVWEYLPENSTLLTRSGVFGYTAFYWQLVYDMRPDVNLPAISNPNPVLDTSSLEQLYSTLLPGTNQGVGSLPHAAMQENAWYIPVMYGESEMDAGTGNGQWILYEVDKQAPNWTVTQPLPQVVLNAEVGDVTLLGFDLQNEMVESGGTLYITLYWQIERPVAASTMLESFSIGENFHHSHRLGFGLLQRYMQETNFKPGQVIREQFALVIPSTLAEGNYPLNLTLHVNRDNTLEIPLAEITVQDEIGMVNGWLN